MDPVRGSGRTRAMYYYNLYLDKPLEKWVAAAREPAPRYYLLLEALAGSDRTPEQYAADLQSVAEQSTDLPGLMDLLASLEKQRTTSPAALDIVNRTFKKLTSMLLHAAGSAMGHTNPSNTLPQRKATVKAAALGRMLTSVQWNWRHAHNYAELSLQNNVASAAVAPVPAADTGSPVENTDNSGGWGAPGAGGWGR